MNTERLYYQDPYLREFTARIAARQEAGRSLAVALDRTAFYPTGGGQPHDTGTLNGIPVLDVIAEDGAIWHRLGDEWQGRAGLAVGDEVAGVVDWDRRFDHMQQHTGQHVLSQAFIQVLGAETVAFHLGATASTIDLDRVDISREQLGQVEAAANRVVDEARPVTPAFVEEADLARVPLRKPPKVTEAIRVVEVAGYDWSACGGTHVNNTAQIGLIKIVGTERRGGELRVTFLCGRRARADYARLQALAEGFTGRFTVGQHELIEAVDRLIGDHKALRKELAELETQWVQTTAAALWAEADTRGDLRVVALAVDYPVDRARRVAQVLRGYPRTVVCLGVKGERPQLIFTRSDDLGLNAGELLRTAAAAGGGRGGGRPDWAQGGVPTNEALDAALAAAMAALA